jgi:ketosteroid isomerase-like protein
MRRLPIGGAIAIVVISLAACSGSSPGAVDAQALQRDADYWQIDQIEKKFHESTTAKDIDEMMSLWAPDATLTVGSGQTAVGLDEIRRFWLEKSSAFKNSTHWISDHPAYKLEITVNGDRGTLHFECHYVDYDKDMVVYVTSGDIDVARIDGQWLITNMVGATTKLKP